MIFYKRPVTSQERLSAAHGQITVVVTGFGHLRELVVLRPVWLEGVVDTGADYVDHVIDAGFDPVTIRPIAVRRKEDMYGNESSTSGLKKRVEHDGRTYQVQKIQRNIWQKNKSAEKNKY